MAGPLNRSPSATTAESDSHAKFLEEVAARWPGAIVVPTPRIADLIRRHDEWLKKKKTNGRSWYDIITDSMDKNWQDHDEFIYDAE
jgi:hypothetical protein